MVARTFRIILPSLPVFVSTTTTLSSLPLARLSFVLSFPILFVLLPTLTSSSLALPFLPIFTTVLYSYSTVFLQR